LVKLGILGGTFDPVHLGHLIIAEEAMTSLGLDRVLFVPAGDPWLKAGMEITPRQHRLAMVLAAVVDNPKFNVSPSELERFGPSYTVETLEEFQEDYGLQTALYFIIGADALRDFGRWHEPQRVLELCTLAVVGRPAQASLDLPELEAILPGIGQRVALVDDVDIDISATDIRQRVAEGRSIKSLVPPAVEAYIQEQHLYKEKR
jgi:nicotinate-nucleotide adenylyltransferase